MASVVSTIRIFIEGSATGIRDAALDAERHLRALQDSTKELDDGLRRSLIGGTKLVGALGSIGGLVPVFGAVAGSATTAAGALLVLPGAALAGAAAIATLKIATSGFGDAVTAADPKAFAEATKGMAPAAREGAQAIRDLSGPLGDLKREVQGQFFAGFAKDVTALGTTFIPILKTGLGGIATEYAGMRQQAVGALLAPASVGAVNAILGDTKGILADMRPALGNVLTGILVLGQEGTAGIRGFGLAVTDVTARFRDWATEAARTGEIARLIAEGKEELRDYGTIAGNVGDILTTIFQGITRDTGDFTTSLIGSTQALEDFLASAEGQDALAALGETLQVTAEVTRTVFLAALKELGPIIREAAPALQEFARTMGSLLVSAIQTVGPMLQDFARFLSDNQSIISSTVPLLAALVLGFSALKILIGITTLIAGAARALELLTSGAGGAARFLNPLIFVLGLAAAAVVIFTSANDDSAEAAGRHQAAVDSLKGSLNQYTGAVTEATRVQVAQELSAKKLADGTTSIGSALQAAGISFNDYSAAASGNGAALEVVNAQLVGAAKSAIQGSEAFDLNRRTLDKYGISLDVVAAAALGNTQAQQELVDKYHLTESSARIMTEQFREQIGPLGELGSTLGGYSGALADAQAQTVQASRAALDFNTVLDALKGGFSGLAGGGAPMAQMVVGFRDLGLAAQQSAQAAGETAEAYGGIGAGADKAAESMKASRQSFIDTAVAADVPIARAEELADSLGLIPEAVRTTYLVQGDAARGELAAINEQLKAVPDAKSVTVTMLSDAARIELDQLGFKIKELPNGEFEIIPNTTLARGELDSLINDANSAVATITVTGDADPFTGEVEASLAFADGSTGTVTLDGNGNPLRAVVDGEKYRIDQTTGTLILEGNQGPVEGKRVGSKLAIDRTTGTIIFLANDSAVVNAKNEAQKPTSSTHTIKVRVVSATGEPLGRGLTGVSGGGYIGHGARVPGFSGGGMVLSGYGPGRDTVGPLWLSPGEAVLVPELVRQIGVANILRANAQASGGRKATILGHFAGGGLVEQPTASRAYLTSLSGANGGPAVPTVLTVPAPVVVNHFYVDGDEFRGMVHSELAARERETSRRVRAGAGSSF